jgi:hypothetical protein
MADLYSQTIVGDGVSTYTLGRNTKRIYPTSEMGTPKITPVVVDTNDEMLPSGGEDWASDDTDTDNYSITGDYQTQGDIFLVVQAIQQFCEVYEVSGSSDSNYLTVMCRDGSIPYDAGDTFQNDGNTITKLQTAVRAALGGAAVLVTIGRVVDNDTDG